MTRLSILDLAPIPEGFYAARALANSADLARHAESLGFHRYWLAEHHNMPGIASAATAVVIGHVAAATSRIRVGAGGIMLPNHAPLVIAEQFGTLAALHPGRIDLGLGRAPGTDQTTAHALRRTLTGGDDRFPQDVMELMDYFEEESQAKRVRAVPGEGLDVPVYILGSSTYGAQLAALLGLPYAFASHFAPAELDHALAIYRERFQPSARLAKPYAIAALGVFAAETRDEAQALFSSQQQAFVNLRSGRAGKLPRPLPGFAETLPPQWRAMMEQSFSCAVVGTRDDVTRGLSAFAKRTGADELMVTAQIWDHDARKRSYAIVAEAGAATFSGAAA